jgi:hypothetical protein
LYKSSMCSLVPIGFLPLDPWLIMGGGTGFTTKKTREGKKKRKGCVCVSLPFSPPRCHGTFILVATVCSSTDTKNGYGVYTCDTSRIPTSGGRVSKQHVQFGVLRQEISGIHCIKLLFVKYLRLESPDITIAGPQIRSESPGFISPPLTDSCCTWYSRLPVMSGNIYCLEDRYAQQSICSSSYRIAKCTHVFNMTVHRWIDSYLIMKEIRYGVK